MSNKYDLQTFQGLILTLQDYWMRHGCMIAEPFDLEVGAGTSHPMTFLRSLGPEPISCAYVQPSRRPTDGRYGENPNRLQHYYQFQVILKPSPDNIQELYLGSLKELGFKNSQTKLIEVIKKPKWIYKNIKAHEADGTFIPDIVTFYENQFIILDAKYYKLKFDEKNLSGQPGLESITKQYLYELAYREFIKENNFKGVKNAFLLPKYTGEIENIGIAKLEILSKLDLEDIQVIMLPADKINQYYLDNKKISIKMLNLIKKGNGIIL